MCHLSTTLFSVGNQHYYWVNVSSSFFLHQNFLKPSISMKLLGQSSPTQADVVQSNNHLRVAFPPLV
jgi:hypothetical protein